MVEGQEEIFLEYMREHYGEDIQLEYSHEILDRKVYKLVRGVE